MIEQETQETPRAAAAFAEYCALGSARSLAKLAQKLGKPSGYTRYLEEWSSQYKWVERARQHDTDLIAERIAKKQALRDEMDERHAREAREDQEMARALMKQSADDDGKVSMAAVQLLKNSREDERRALIEEEKPAEQQPGQWIGIAVYLPQKLSLKGGDANASSES